MKIKIINTGGTFNKVYDKIKGELVVPKNNYAVEEIIKKSFIDRNIQFDIEGIIYKDSLDMTNEDRKLILEKIKKSKENKIIIIHGTDTIDKTADFLNQHFKDKQIILTGAMEPFSINKIEATSNFSLALSHLILTNKKGIYIAMNGLISSYKNIIKDRKLGVFKQVN